MPTIDELIIKVSIDAAGAEEGQKKLHDEMEKTKRHTEEVAKQISESGKKAAEFFKHLRDEAIALFAVVTGGMGMERFVESTIDAAGAQEQFARGIGMSTQAVQAWVEAGVIMGGTADEMKQSMSGLSSEIQKYIMGEPTDIANVLGALHIPLEDMNNMTKLMPEIAHRIQEMRAAGASIPQLEEYMRKMHFSPSMMHAMEDPELFKQLEEGMKRALSSENTEKATKLAESWQKLLLTFKDFAQQTFLETFGTDIQGAITATQQWMDANKGWLEGQIGDKVHKVIEDLKKAYNSQEAKDFLKFLQSLWDMFIEICKAVGGPTHMLEIMLGLFVAEKMSGPIGVIKDLALAFTSLGVSLGWVPAAVIALTALSTFLGWLGGMGQGFGDITITPPPTSGPVSPGGSNFSPLTWQSLGDTYNAIKNLFIKGADAVDAPERNLANQTMDFFMSPEGGGWSREQAAALASSARRESDFGNDASTNWGAGHGVYQWDKTRRDAIEEHFHKRVEDMTLREANAALAWEIGPTGPEAAAGRVMRAATDAYSATAAAKGIERYPRDNQVEDTARYGLTRAYLGLPELPPATPGNRGLAPPPIPAPQRSGSNVITNNVNIASLVVNTPATDAHGLARDLRGALQRNLALAGPINVGMA